MGQPDASTPGTPGSAGAAGLSAGADASMPDAHTPADAGPYTCSVEGAMDLGCTGYICAYEGMPVLVVKGTQDWTIGALDWTASVCDRPIGWPSTNAPEPLMLIYSLTLDDLSELRAGAPVYVYYSNPTSPPVRAQVCAIDVAEPLPACPQTSAPPLHVSFRGCRGPRDPNCAVCKELSGAYRSSTDGNRYDASSLSDPGCGATCLYCASCTYHDEEESRALEQRPGCLPCVGPFGDACFSPSSCECWCQNRKRLNAACPTLVPN